MTSVSRPSRHANFWERSSGPTQIVGAQHRVCESAGGVQIHRFRHSETMWHSSCRISLVALLALLLVVPSFSAVVTCGGFVETSSALAQYVKIRFADVFLGLSMPAASVLVACAVELCASTMDVVPALAISYAGSDCMCKLAFVLLPCAAGERATVLT